MIAGAREHPHRDLLPAAGRHGPLGVGGPVRPNTLARANVFGGADPTHLRYDVTAVVLVLDAFHMVYRYVHRTRRKVNIW